MLSTKEASQFLSEQLQLPHRKYGPDSSPTLDQLNEIVHEFHMKIPFQNITLLAKPRGTQDIPSKYEIKHDLMRGLGGLCYTNNVFMAQLLSALGLNAHHLASTCNPKHPNNHILSLVKDLTSPGSQHIVDVGCGYPTYQVIPMDFERGSAIYTSAFLSYKFSRSNDQFNRAHLQDFREGLLGANCVNKDWEWFYDFDLVPRDLAHFQPAMSEVYRDRFLKKLRLLVFHKDSMVGVKGLGDTAVLFKLTGNHTDTTELRNTEEIVSTLHELAPVLDRQMVKTAVENWRHFATGT